MLVILDVSGKGQHVLVDTFHLYSTWFVSQVNISGAPLLEQFPHNAIIV